MLGQRWNPNRLAVALAASAGALTTALVIAHGCGGGSSDSIFVENFQGERSKQLTVALTQLAEHSIPDSYEALRAELVPLQESAGRFCAAPDEGGLESVQSAWRSSIAAWARAKVVSFGP